MLDDLLARLGALPPEEKKATVHQVIESTKDLCWIPNPGPQELAYFCPADELFYGGQAGGGKSDLLIGLGLTAHLDSLILRRLNDDAKDLAARGREIAGEDAGYNGQDKILTLGARKLRFVGCQYEEDAQRYKGRAKDYYGFDEISDFTRSQYKFITTWNRSAKPGQRCRVVCAGNPPTRPEGLWVLQYWGPWLDPKHPNPAQPGELRWFVTGEDDQDLEVDGPGPHVFEWSKKPLKARSRTFIPAKLSDNPDLAKTDYEATLDNLPAHLRAAYRDGNFQAELRDDEFQVIPTSWILQAMHRWKPEGWREHHMTAMACDAAGGGADAAVIATRHAGWYAPLVAVKGPETADANVMAGRIIQARRDNCPVVLDTGGGYGGGYALRLADNGITVIAYKGAEASTGVTKDGAHLRFANRRAETWWRFREALDPSQEGGSVIALPPDDELKADLASVHYEVTRQGILLEPKDNIKKRIGRSPDKGDTVTMCLSMGDKAGRRSLGGSGRPLPKVNLAYSQIKRRH
jgi:hypothetical protein